MKDAPELTPRFIIANILGKKKEFSQDSISGYKKHCCRQNETYSAVKQKAR